MTTSPAAADGPAPPRPGPGHSKPPTDVDELRADIAHTRAELGETVQALAARADVKARLQETADEARARVREAAEEAMTAAAEAPERAQQLASRTGRAVRRNPVPLVVVAGAAVLIVLFIRWRRNR